MMVLVIRSEPGGATVVLPVLMIVAPVCSPAFTRHWPLARGSERIARVTLVYGVSTRLQIGEVDLTAGGEAAESMNTLPDR